MQPNAPMMQGRPGTPMGFPVINSTLPNLQIPPGKQRGIAAGQQPGTPSSAAGSAPSPQIRNQLPIAAAAVAAAASQHGSPAAQRLFQQGIPVASPVPGSVRPPGQFPVPPGTQVTPMHILSDLDKRGALPTAQPPPGRATNDIIPAALDRTGSLLSKTSWTPTAESDAALRSKLNDSFLLPGRQTGRATLLEGMSTVPVLANVLGERLPADLRLLAEGDVETKNETLEAKSKKHDLEGAGMPGAKKQKIQEFAETVDKSLEIDKPVEDVSSNARGAADVKIFLSLSDEYVDLLAQTACQFTKHRKSSTIDRKDAQLAYESIYGRTLPGFSSDAIRLDQARSSRRAPTSQQRQAKLKLVADARAQWRREKEENAKAAEEAAAKAQAQAALNGTMNGEMKDDATTAAPTAINTAVGTAQTSAVTTPAPGLAMLGAGTDTPTAPPAPPVVVAL
jgi:hypothetical protein